MVVTEAQGRYTLNPESAAPLYHQIREDLRGKIEDEVLGRGQMLPSERELSLEYGVNRLTLRQAIGELVHEGLLRRVHGVGTFVEEPKVTLHMELAAGFSEVVRQAGHERSSQMISLEVVPARAKIAGLLNVEPGAPTEELHRLRLTDDEPFMIETVFLPHERFPGLDEVDLAQEPLYRTLRERYGCIPAETEDMLEPVFLDAYERGLLKTHDNSLGLLVEATTRDSEGIAFEFSKSIVRGDRSRYLFRSRNVLAD